MCYFKRHEIKIYLDKFLPVNKKKKKNYAYIHYLLLNNKCYKHVNRYIIAKIFCLNVYTLKRNN